MSYRNDHDAALARVNALASENSQLAAENAKLRAGMTIVVPQAERPVHRGVAALVLASLAGASILAATLISHSHHRAPPPHEHHVVVDEAELRACARTLETSPPGATARETDPRSWQHLSIGPVMMSTGCRAEIAEVLDGAILSNDERATLQRWRNSEANLDAVVSMIGEYYKHDPYALDGYSTAPQLWREYDEALTHRNIALAQWLDASREVTP